MSTTINPDQTTRDRHEQPSGELIIEKLEMVMARVKLGKAAGINGTTPEMVKCMRKTRKKLKTS